MNDSETTIVQITGLANETFEQRWKVKRRKRASFACVLCRTRKIRCNVQVENGPCTNCILDETTCQIDLSKLRARQTPDFPKQDTSRRECGVISVGIQPQLCISDCDSSLDPKQCESPSKSDSHRLPFWMIGCDPGIAHHLVQCYLHHVYPRLPVLTANDLEGILIMLDGETPSCGWFVVNALFAASVRFIDHAIVRQCGFHFRRDALQFFLATAKSSYEMEAKRNTYPVIQGLLLLSVCENDSPRWDSTVWLGLAHSSAVSIALDQEHSKIQQPEKGLRKRLWWSLFSQVSLLHLLHGTDPPSWVKQVTIPRPDYDDFEQETLDNLFLHKSKQPSQPLGGKWSSVNVFLRGLDLLQQHNDLPNSRYPCQGNQRTFKEPISSLDRYKFGTICPSLIMLKPGPVSQNGFSLYENDQEFASTLLDMERLLFNP